MISGEKEREFLTAKNLPARLSFAGLSKLSALREP